MKLLTKQQIIDSKLVPIVPATRDFEIDPEINACLNIDMYELLSFEMWTDLVALQTKEIVDFTVQELALYDYFNKNIIQWCIYQVFFNYITGADGKITPSGMRTFQELYSLPSSDNVFAGKVDKFRILKDKMIVRLYNVLEKDTYTIGTTIYKKLGSEKKTRILKNDFISFVQPRTYEYDNDFPTNYNLKDIYRPW